ncbi:MAG: ribonuclease J [Acidobacteria bacterium]|nr:ribonuclease J [Acidobacteriota bacterium]MBV9070828.1 ribonuclease J [Acidobacteriota bacterium]MBV9186475.1 ribonuclease J [Acidobacteriota bacterium]
MNLMVYEYADAAIVVDCGMMFPDATTLGVDVIVPDMSYLFERPERVKAVFLTHGHEDHIGAVPFLVEKLNVPVYGMPLTLGFVRDKLEEFAIDNVELRAFMPRDVVEAGPFRVEAIQVTHSIVDAIGLAIRTPAGTLIHTGDFKIDHTPVDGKRTDLARFAAYGEEGVLALMSDSTNALVPGHGASEKSVGRGLGNIFANATGRIIVTTFASHIHRVQQIVDTARKYKRKVFLIGRSLVDNAETAERLGYLRIAREQRPGANAKPSDYADDEVVILTTGTQGEPRSALSRMAIGEHKQVEVQRGDVVVISARVIPGNERSVSHVIDNLYRRGAEVLNWENSDVHVSGHACEEELKLMLNVTRPKFFIPIHGTLRHLIHHARLAKSVGVPHGVVITNGQVASIENDEISVLPDRVAHGKVFIDGEAEEVPEIVVRDRQHLAEDGFVIAVVAIDSSGHVGREPEIITRGLLHVDESQDILADVRAQLVQMLHASPPDELLDHDVAQEKMRALLKRYFRKEMGRRPMILPVIWEM